MICWKRDSGFEARLLGVLLSNGRVETKMRLFAPDGQHMLCTLELPLKDLKIRGVFDEPTLRDYEWEAIPLSYTKFLTEIIDDVVETVGQLFDVEHRGK